MTSVSHHLGLSGAPILMGIVNVTPDSFSDGGRYIETDAALTHARQLVADGAAIVDVGGESTRPGATPVPEDVEAARIIPVIRELAHDGIVVSVDTLHASTAEAAMAAGARIINDVSGGEADENMAQVVAATDAVYIAGHRRGNSSTMNDLARYDDVVSDVRSELVERIEVLRRAGVGDSHIVIDPGLGFAKTGEHNWTLLSHLDDLASLGFPVLIGASRKRFIAELLASDAPVADRDAPSAFVAALALNNGAWGARVHDVRATRVALDVLDQWRTSA